MNAVKMTERRITQMQTPTRHNPARRRWTHLVGAGATPRSQS